VLHSCLASCRCSSRAELHLVVLAEKRLGELTLLSDGGV
jgi:hypothetical protein